MDTIVLVSRRILLFALALFISAFAALAAPPSVTLAWDPSPDAGVTNYNLYWGPTSKTPTNHIAVGNVTTTVFTNLVSGARYYFVVTALGNGAESVPSNEVDFQVAPAPPSRLRFTVTVQSSSNLRDWKSSGVAVMTEAEEAAFYRLAMDRPLVVYEPSKSPSLSPLSVKGLRVPFGNAETPSKMNTQVAPIVSLPPLPH